MDTEQERSEATEVQAVAPAANPLDDDSGSMGTSDIAPGETSPSTENHESNVALQELAQEHPHGHPTLETAPTESHSQDADADALGPAEPVLEPHREFATPQHDPELNPSVIDEAQSLPTDAPTENQESSDHAFEARPLGDFVPEPVDESAGEPVGEPVVEPAGGPIGELVGEHADSASVSAERGVDGTDRAAQPTEPVVEPTEPVIEPTEPTVQPTEPAMEPTAPAEPAGPGTPTELVEPTAPGEPAESIEPTENPPEQNEPNPLDGQPADTAEETTGPTPGAGESARDLPAEPTTETDEPQERDLNLPRSHGRPGSVMSAPSSGGLNYDDEGSEGSDYDPESFRYDASRERTDRGSTSYRDDGFSGRRRTSGGSASARSGSSASAASRTSRDQNPSLGTDSRALTIKEPFTASEQAAYDDFLEDENRYVQQARWDQFPYGSRVFIGNLPTERITKQQLFKLFHKYGRIAQISKKAAYGFVQFHEPRDCARAIEDLQNVRIEGNVLEVSKPQSSKNTRQERRPRSRSPPPRYEERGGGKRLAPEYRRRQSPPPPPKKRRGPPDCVILLIGRVSNSFVDSVEDTLRYDLTVDVDELQRHIPLNQAMQSAAYDGVHGVVILERYMEQSGLINVHVFEKSPGGGVKFDEYTKVTPVVALELIKKAKRGSRDNISGSGYPKPISTAPQTGSPAPQIQMPMMPFPGFAMPNVQNMPFVAPGQAQQQNPNANIMGQLQNMDPAAVQALFSMFQQAQQQQQPPQPQQWPGQPAQQASLPPEFGAFQQYYAAQLQQQQPQQQAQQQQQQATPTWSVPPAPQAPGTAEELKNIMDQLAMLQGKK